MRRDVSLLWVSTPCEVVEEILELSLMTGHDRRLFISYAHSDGHVVAEQLFAEMNKHRFDVFLDRFRTPPGTDFVERIEDELIDKSMVVVVETPKSVASAWVRHEVATARRLRLGLAAINDGSVAGFTGVGSPRRYQYAGSFSPSNAAEFVIQRHREAIVHRRLTLLQSIQREFSSGAPSATIDVHGDGCRVELADAPLRSLELGLAIRPATIDLTRRTDDRSRSRPATPVVIHARPGSPRRRADLDWLMAKGNIVQVDIGKLREFARRAKAGTL
jgi:hypothetical protein